MTITLDLGPEVEARLNAEAQAHQMPIENYLQTLITNALSGEKKMGLAALFDAWALEDATDDPDELSAREQDLVELQTNLNANHTSDRKLFP